MPTPIPVERLVTKGEAYVTAHPEDPMGIYTLARIHYAAFIYRSATLGTFLFGADDASQPPRIPDARQGLYDPGYPLQVEARRRVIDEKGLKEPVQANEDFGKAIQEKISELKAANWQAPAMTPADVLKHFLAARDAFDKATAMKPDDALFALGKASLWAQFSTPEFHQSLEKEPGVPAAMATRDLADLFYRAFVLAKTDDTKIQHVPLRGLQEIVSYEAGTNYLKLAPQGDHAKEIDAFLTTLKSGLKRGPITPLVFSTRKEDQALSDLIDASARVEFDLGGIGDQRIWPWLKPAAAWLVWDGEDNGNIRDGRQLFGTYTWGVFWRDGFEALSMLDDNNDGVVSGAELKNIAVWQDRNGNAVSDGGEVLPLSEAGIKSLRCTADGEEDGHPKHEHGIRFKDGGERPLWDWIARPHGEAP